DVNGGSAVVGDNLTGNYSYTDVDGDTEGTSTFRWLRGSTPIGGATASSYTLVAADSGQTIVFEVTPVAIAGILTGSAVASSGLTITNSAPTANSVTITDYNGGNAEVGDILTGNYVYTDVDGDTEGTSTFRWLRGGTPIAGATASTYTLVAADSGQTIVFEVTPVAIAEIFTGSAVASSGLTITNSAPMVSSVTITDDNGGGTFVGDILTGNYVYSDVDGDAEGTSTFRWLRNGAPISGANALNYTVVSVDSGQPITFEVTPVAVSGILTGSAVTSSSITIANDVIAPTVSSTNPVNTATSVALNAAITANFNEDIFSVTVDNSSFTLSNGSNISGAVTFDGVTNTATFTPDSNLDMLTTYTATLTTAITDLAGNALASSYIWSFTTEGDVWGTAELIEFNNEGNALNPQIAANNSGNAIAVWVQVIAGQTSVLANRYVAGVGWGTTELIEVAPGAASAPQVVIDDFGNAIAIWSQDDLLTAGSPKSIWANRYTTSFGWETAQLIESGSGTALSPQISADALGSVAIVVWRQYNGAVNNIWANRYAFGLGWESAVRITTDNTTDAFDPQVAVDSSGNAVAVWQQNSVETNIVTNLYTFGLGWGTAVSIDGYPGPANSPQVGVDSIGNAIVVWRQYDGSIDSIVANRYTFGFGWGTAELIENGINSALPPQISVDSNGNAIVVWLQDDNVQANRYTTFTGWETAETIETNVGTPFTPQVSVDNSGNAIAIWTQNISGQTSVLANRYTTGAGWGVAALIETNAGLAYDPQIAIGSGNTMTVWSQDDGVRLNIHSNRLP
ncbi:MAG: Ig-like domain-containing protein, partial [Gammaproteobacteria bacterium]|nr:Ig-like domain-containing protein [Gammaproteobacteria bacterium]